ncbi:MAG TPA: alanine racemase [Acidimicrobiales bacterium]|nr:alanine racemase [Acidimicrobiales bacterium]
MHVADLTTPALVVDADRLDDNIATMAARLPGPRLRPHVKAHKTTLLAARQAAAGHLGFTCATVREVEGMAAAGLGHDLLLANEVVDARRLGAAAAGGARVTLAVDSEATVEAAAAGGVREVLIDVNVGLPRCGCRPDDAGRLADLARSRGLEVRGVMGYEGHVTIIEDRAERAAAVEAAMTKLVAAADAVGGDVISGGATVSWDLNPWVTELQAGSYALMDTTFAPMTPEFAPALSLVATVISVSRRWAVCDAGLKSLGMDHGNPTMADGAGEVLLVSDEHVVFAPAEGTEPTVGDRVRLLPAHVDPTVAYHEHLHVVRDDEVLESWPVDLRGW